ncbi:ARM repeat-containing protein [Testicularia cyperi]|uniref:Nucleolar protein 9 n=1 Tax=Testicularia cyperi TaxID=1882483 RepID=A0A317XNL9_9BASI|nr:ARM repeat-containing protein [Testicularia cyperi]
MVEKVRKRGKKPSKLRKLEADAAADSAIPSKPAQALDTNADFIALDDDAAEGDASMNDAAQANGEWAEEGAPNWVRLQDRPSKAATEAPFGYVDAEIKAYFRSAYERINELESQAFRAPSLAATLHKRCKALQQSSSSSADAAAAEDAKDNDNDKEDDDLELLLHATLQEMDGKELALCTDPDTSIIVEGVLERLPSKPLRVFVDRLAGNLAVLSRHRFGSHVVQACLAHLQTAITLEHVTDQDLLSRLATTHGPSTASKEKGKGKNKHKPSASRATADRDSGVIVNEDGILRSATQLVLDMAEELAPELSALVTDAFGSHVVRSLFSVLTGRNVHSPSTDASTRSRRSAKFRAKKGPDSSAAAPSAPPINLAELVVAIPDLLQMRAGELLAERVVEKVSPTDLRSWATDAVASPTLQLLMQIEAGNLSTSSTDVESWRSTIVDTVLDGLVVESLDPSTEHLEGQDKVELRKSHLESSLRDSVASHVVQLAISYAPSSTAERFFAIYISTRLGKLSVHPAANFVVAATVRRLPAPVVAAQVADQIDHTSQNMVRENMVGTIQAFVERVAVLTSVTAADSAHALDRDEAAQLVRRATQVVLNAFDLHPTVQAGDLKLLLPTILALKTKSDFLNIGKKDDSKKSKKRSRDGKTKSKSKSKESKSKKNGEEDDVNEDAGSTEHGNQDEKEDEDGAEKGWTMAPDHEVTSQEATMQGSLLLQSLLKLPLGATPPAVTNRRVTATSAKSASSQQLQTGESGASLVIDSLLSQTSLFPWIKNSVSVHVILATLTSTSSSVSASAAGGVGGSGGGRRKIFPSLLASLPEYCGDKYGSRVADALWLTADGYSKLKIAQTVVSHQATILKSPFSSFFTQRLNLQLYRKNARAWEDWAKQLPLLSTPPAQSQSQSHDAGYSRAGTPIVVQLAAKQAARSRKSLIDRQLDDVLKDL